ncbi:MAG: signal peptidase I [Bryobacteraceae bacterium]
MKRQERIHAFAREIAEWAANLIVLLFATTTIAQPFVVPTGSMENTVLIGDHLIVDKLAYAPHGAFSRRLLPYSEVRPGDIIVLRYPPDIRETYVKRVIGVPGDRIRIVNKQVFRNGRPLDEPYKLHRSPDIQPLRDNLPGPPLSELAHNMIDRHVAGGDLVVPEGRYFALGDNRDDSADSRYWGLVPRENIIGKPWIIFWSYDAPTARLADRNVVNFDHLQDLALHFFTKTRWERTFQIVRGARVQ